MDRSRSKRSYHHDHDSDSQTPPPRSKPRYDDFSHRRTFHHRRNPDRRQHPPPPPPPSSDSVTTFFRLLCPDSKIPAVVGKSGNAIKAVRHDTGAWITVHDLLPGDEERVIETADGRRREPDGRPPHYSPAQEALLRIHERMLEAEAEEGGQDREEYEERGRERRRVTSRLVVSGMHVGCLLGMGGKIIEHMRNETKTHIRVLPRDQPTPRCVAMTEEVVQGPDDELFPAQEALLHIQTHIVDLGPDKDNIITTGLLVQASEIEYLEGKDGSLSDFKRLTCANVQVLPKEDLPLCALETDEIIQIVGEIRAARNALMQVTARLRGYFYRDLSVPQDAMPLPFPATNLVGKVVGLESSSIRSLPREGYQGSDTPVVSFENVRTSSTNWPSKDSAMGASGPLELEQNFINDSVRHNGLKRFTAPLVTKSTFEVVIPVDAVSSLITKSGSKLAQISEMSGATMILLEDRPDSSDKVVQISGTPEQAERAQSLLQGFILSTL